MKEVMVVAGCACARYAKGGDERVERSERRNANVSWDGSDGEVRCV